MTKKFGGCIKLSNIRITNKCEFGMLEKVLDLRNARRVEALRKELPTSVAQLSTTRYQERKHLR